MNRKIIESESSPRLPKTSVLSQLRDPLFLFLKGKLIIMTFASNKPAHNWDCNLYEAQWCLNGTRKHIYQIWRLTKKLISSTPSLGPFSRGQNTLPSRPEWSWMNTQSARETSKLCTWRPLPVLHLAEVALRLQNLDLGHQLIWPYRPYGTTGPNNLQLSLALTTRYAWSGNICECGCT